MKSARAAAVACLALSCADLLGVQDLNFDRDPDGGAMDAGQAGSSTVSEGGVDAAAGASGCGDDCNWPSLVAGSTHTCYLHTDGTVSCWGAAGRLGDGTTTGGSAPVRVSGLSGVTQIASSGFSDHTCALLEDGTVWCWGSGYDGELGDGHLYQVEPRVSVSPVQALDVESAIYVATGPGMTCAVLAGGPTKCWGKLGDWLFDELDPARDPSVPIAVPRLDGLVELAFGTWHGCGLLEGGTAKCWGGNFYGQLGTGTFHQSEYYAPTEVPGLTSVVAIGVSEHHSCAALSDGSAMCWGLGSTGQLGIGLIEGVDPPSRLSPTLVTELTNIHAIAIAPEHTCAASPSRVNCWGFGGEGQIGDYSSVPIGANTVPVPLEGVAHVAAGKRHSCAELEDGTAWCWGDRSDGQLGDGSTETTPSFDPVKVLDVP